MVKTVNYGKTFKTVAEKIYSFGIGGRFLFASVMTGTVSIKHIYYEDAVCQDLSNICSNVLAHVQFNSSCTWCEMYVSVCKNHGLKAYVSLRE